MRTKTGQRLGALGVILASVVLAGFTSTASAGDGYRRGKQIHRSSVYDPYYAGTLRIGDHWFDLRTDSFVRNEIAYRFRRLGYDAWSANEKVFIRVGYRHRPLVRWLSGTHRVSTWYEGDCLVIKVIPPSHGHYVGVKKPYQPSCGNWRKAGRRGPWRQGPWAGRPYARGSIGLKW